VGYASGQLAESLYLLRLNQSRFGFGASSDLSLEAQGALLERMGRFDRKPLLNGETHQEEHKKHIPRNKPARSRHIPSEREARAGQGAEEKVPAKRHQNEREPKMKNLSGSGFDDEQNQRQRTESSTGPAQQYSDDSELTLGDEAWQLDLVREREYKA
jgi:hypothetical protein